MNIGVVLCLMLGGVFLLFGILFAILKGKGTILISGFNSMTKEERAKYDQIAMSRDMSHKLFLWCAIFFVGGFFSYFISWYSAIVVGIIWVVLFIKEVHLDEEKAFGKYRFTVIDNTKE